MPPQWKDVITVPIQNTMHEKNQLTVCLAVKPDGTKSKPFVVTPAQKVKSFCFAYSNSLVAATSNDWINDEITLDWLRTVLN